MSVGYGILTIVNAAVFAQERGSFWMPPKGATTATGVDWLFYFIFWISVVFFAIIVGVLTVFLFKYRRRPGHAPQESPSHSLVLELTWSIIPLILVIVLFAIGFVHFIDMNTMPANAYEILVTAQRWSWAFTYPNGYVDDELHVPVDTPVVLTMRSEDVIHSFFIPAFRVKKDVVPGRYTKVWFRATEEDSFIIFCAEYCGTQHSDMLSWCHVHPPGEYETWLADASDFISKLPPAEAGKRIYNIRGCKQCHSIDGTANVGPSFQGVFGEDVKLADGTSVLADENYLHRSITEPNADIVAGYEDVPMPTYKGRLRDEEIQVIVEFIKSLKH